METDNLQVARAAGQDICKMEIAAAVRPSRRGTDAQVATAAFSALSDSLTAMVDWLQGLGVTAAVMEAAIEACLFRARHRWRPSSTSVAAGC